MSIFIRFSKILVIQSSRVTKHSLDKKYQNNHLPHPQTDSKTFDGVYSKEHENDRLVNQ